MSTHFVQVTSADEVATGDTIKIYEASYVVTATTKTALVLEREDSTEFFYHMKSLRSQVAAGNVMVKRAVPLPEGLRKRYEHTFDVTDWAGAEGSASVLDRGASGDGDWPAVVRIRIDPSNGSLDFTVEMLEYLLDVTKNLPTN